jgi:hypothetical protein
VAARGESVGTRVDEDGGAIVTTFCGGLDWRSFRGGGAGVYFDPSFYNLFLQWG